MLLTALQLQSCLSQNLSALALPWEVEVFDRIDSTSSELMRQAKLRALAPKVLVSLEQTHGRGRGGKAWFSNQNDSLTFSIGLPLKPLSWLGLSLCVGIDLAHSLDPGQGLDLKLKWPNDVWVYKADRFHKLAGILIETINPNPDSPFSISQARYCVIGVGVNFNTPDLQTHSLQISPMGLSDLGSGLSRQELITQMVSKLTTTLKLFEREGFLGFKTKFDQLDCLKGREIHLSDGTTGQCLGVNHQGELLVLQNGYIRTIVSMDVSVRPRNPLQ